METIMIVDNDMETINLLRPELDRAGYQVITACSGAEAIRVIGERHVDAVLIGELTAPFSWFEFAKWLDAISSADYIWKFLMKSESVDNITDEFVLTTFRASIDHTFLKPINPKEVIAALRFSFRARERTHE